MERLVETIPHVKLTHFAAEAQSLHAHELRDFTLPKRLTLLVCLIHHETIATRDEIVQMFLKRMGKLRDKAKEENAFPINTSTYHNHTIFRTYAQRRP